MQLNPRHRSRLARSPPRALRPRPVATPTPKSAPSDITPVVHFLSATVVCFAAALDTERRILETSDYIDTAEALADGRNP